MIQRQEEEIYLFTCWELDEWEDQYHSRAEYDAAAKSWLA